LVVGNDAPCSARYAKMLRLPLCGSAVKEALRTNVLRWLGRCRCWRRPRASHSFLEASSWSCLYRCECHAISGRNPKLLWSGRRRHLCRYLLGGAALESLTLVERQVYGSCTGLLRARSGGRRGGGSGRWMYAEAAASDGHATAALWGRPVALHGMGGDLVLRGWRVRLPGRGVFARLSLNQSCGRGFCTIVP
jgi:hypothetical protein